MPKFVPRIRKQKAKARAAVPAQQQDGVDNSNAVEIIPSSKAEVEERRRKLREEIRAQQPESKFSSKKKKRLEHYIDTKLRKEENLELIKKLASQKIDTSLLRSSKNLGRVEETKKEHLGRLLKERRAGLADEDDEDDDLLEERELPPAEVLDHQPGASFPQVLPAVPAPVTTSSATSFFGTGLKRPLEVDELGNPVIKKRQRTKLVPKPKGWTVVAPAPEETPEEDDEDSWEGFGSDDDASTSHKSILKARKGDEGGDEDEQPRHDADEEARVKAALIKQLMEDASSEEDASTEDDGDDDDDDDGDEETGDENSEDDEEANDGTSEEDASDVDQEDSDEEDDEDDEGDEDVNQAQKAALKDRASAFKAWASAQRNDALGFTPSVNTDFFAVPAQSKHSATGVSTGDQSAGNGTAAMADPSKDFLLGTIKAPESGETSRVIHNVAVTRDAAIQEARSALPVVAEEQKIMEAINNNDCVIIWGATGSGKTTQVPQFLFEAGYGSAGGPTPGMIGVTQPRRVAAVSMAKRVATELGEHSDKVAHQIRFDSTVSSKTAIKFMTDGVLLREIHTDFMLNKYSAIVLDEAHERSVNTDLLIGMLCRIVEMRAEQAKKPKPKYKPLKLIIMSATLRTADLTSNRNLFRTGPPPTVQAEGRQYPVTVHFARRTQRDYLDEVFNKVSRGHKKLPPGGMLVFLTGQNEITALAKRLKSELDATDSSVKSYSNVRISAAEATIEDEDVELGYKEKIDVSIDDNTGDESDDDIHGADNDEEFNIGEDPHEMLKVHVLPLYSQLPTEQQMRVFQPPPPGARLIVLATNVAETSVTIPGIRYVFDCGRAKEKRYNPDTGVQSFEVDWISKASASQRTGRAGRTGPGHCYRLYSSAVYERDFAEFAEPEITRTPIEGVVLQLKSMGVPKVAAFPFPTPPDRESLVKAEKLLEYLGALSADGKVTRAGEQLSLYPLSPRLSRMLCLAQNHGVIDYTLALVAALAVRDLFIPDSQLQLEGPKPLAADDAWTEADNQAVRAAEERKKAYNHFHGHVSRLDRHSDALKLLTLLGDFARGTNNRDDYYKFTRVKAMNEALQLRGQLAALVAVHNPGSVSSTIPAALPDPSKAQISLLRQIVAAGYIDQVAIRADMSPTPPESGRKPKRTTDVPYITFFSSDDAAGRAHADAAEDPDAEARRKYVYIHPSSVLAHTAMDKLPQYLIYSHLSRGAASVVAGGKLPKTRLHPLTPVSATQLVALAQGTPLLEEGKPVGKIEQLARDEKGSERRACLTVPFLKGETRNMGWPLPPARRVVQVRDSKRGWVAEGS